MATITPVTPSIAGAVVTPTASTPAGDVVPYQGGDLLLKFTNGHSSTVTVNVVPTQPTQTTPSAGTVSTPTRSLALDQDEEGVMVFKAAEISAYLNSSRQLPITYTSGNAALTVLPVNV